MITTVIDNLLKGASGQAVHNMNLLFGLQERVGLALKPSAFWFRKADIYTHENRSGSGSATEPDPDLCIGMAL